MHVSSLVLLLPLVSAGVLQPSYQRHKIRAVNGGDPMVVVVVTKTEYSLVPDAQSVATFEKDAVPTVTVTRTTTIAQAASGSGAAQVSAAASSNNAGGSDQNSDTTITRTVTKHLSRTNSGVNVAAPSKSAVSGSGSTNNGGSSSANRGGSGSNNNGGSGSTNNGGSSSTNNGGSGSTNNGGSGSTNNGGSGSTNNGGSGSTNNGGSGSTASGVSTNSGNCPRDTSGKYLSPGVKGNPSKSMLDSINYMRRLYNPSANCIAWSDSLAAASQKCANAETEQYLRGNSGIVSAPGYLQTNSEYSGDLASTAYEQSMIWMLCQAPNDPQLKGTCKYKTGEANCSGGACQGHHDLIVDANNSDKFMGCAAGNGPSKWLSCSFSATQEVFK